MRRDALAPIRTALVVMGCTLPALAAHAAPDPNDLVAKLLIDRGVIDAKAFDGPTGEPVDSAASIGLAPREGSTDLVVVAMNYLGVPYKLGGNDADDGFDCSGFTRQVYEQSLGLQLPRTVNEQAQASSLKKISKRELQPGDLVFFNTLRRTFSHVGIYIGKGQFIHAPKAGAEVRLESIDVRYWSRRFTGARRASQTVAAVPLARPAEATAAALIDTLPANSIPP